VGAALWLLVPFVAGPAAGVWAWRTGRRTPGPPDRDAWEDLDRFERLRAVLSAEEQCARRRSAHTVTEPSLDKTRLKFYSRR